MVTLPDRRVINLGYAPKLREHVATVPVAHEAILYEEDEGNLHRLNATAAIVSTFFDGEVTLGTLIDDLVAVFEGDRETIEADVLAMTRELARKGLLDGIPGDGETEAVDTADPNAEPANSDAASDA